MKRNGEIHSFLFLLVLAVPLPSASAAIWPQHEILYRWSDQHDCRDGVKDAVISEAMSIWMTWIPKIVFIEVTKPAQREFILIECWNTLRVHGFTGCTTLTADGAGFLSHAIISLGREAFGHSALGVSLHELAHALGMDVDIPPCLMDTVRYKGQWILKPPDQCLRYLAERYDRCLTA